MEGWWDFRACRDADPRIFDEQEGHRRPDWREANSYCERCPVKRECLAFVLSFPADLWAEQFFAAGRSPQELNLIRRTGRRAS